jgi:hypothetical protein
MNSAKIYSTSFAGPSGKRSVCVTGERGTTTLSGQFRWSRMDDPVRKLQPHWSGATCAALNPRAVTSDARSAWVVMVCSLGRLPPPGERAHLPSGSPSDRGKRAKFSESNAKSHWARNRGGDSTSPDRFSPCSLSVLPNFVRCLLCL